MRPHSWQASTGRTIREQKLCLGRSHERPGSNSNTAACGFNRMITFPQTPYHRLQGLLAMAALVAVGLPGSDGRGSPAAPWELLGEPLGGTWLALGLLVMIGAAWPFPKHLAGAWFRSVVGIIVAMVAAYALGQRVHAGYFDAAPTVSELLGATTASRAAIILLSSGLLGAMLWALEPPDRREQRRKAVWTTVAIWVLAGCFAPLIFGLKGGDMVSLLGLAETIAEGPVSDKVAAVSFCMGLAVGTAAPLWLLRTSTRVSAQTIVGLTWVLTFLVPLVATAIGSAYPDRWSEASESLKLSLTVAVALLFASASSPWWGARHHESDGG